ncbi:MAG: ATP-binding protein [Hyphomicrobiales bacterium]|nr:ATP-binding protein [Hyphomicrobiales bacterium]
MRAATALASPAPRDGAATIGRVLAVTGSQVTVGLITAGAAGVPDPRATVGKFLSIHTTRSVAVGMITEVSADVPQSARDHGYRALARLDLMGEIMADGRGFQRGVAVYPAIGDGVAMLTSAELRVIYERSGPGTIGIGALHQDRSVVGAIDSNELVGKHFAVVGTTGVGKSSGVAIILHELLRVRTDLRIFLVDAHNEYGRFFGEQALVLTPRNVKLPFWLFSFEEIVDVIFGGRPGVDEEIEILAEVIPLAKGSYTHYRGPSSRVARAADTRSCGFTIDTPVPYRLVDLIGLIDERMGKLENRASRLFHQRLLTRIETLRNDPRYAFMFDNANVGGDTMAEVLGQLFRMPANGKPMTIMQLAGFPAEVVDAVISVLGRMAFDFGLWSDGAIQLLFVCEEAHRYASADRKIGFGPTRRAISRIAKEGRKYGVFLGLVTQRPAELDPTILSQCSTLFAMRLSNERDQALVRSAVSDAAAGLLSFLPSLATREVFAFGEGVALPTRLTFSELATDVRLRSELLGDTVAARQVDSTAFIASVIERWRAATMSQRRMEENSAELGSFTEPPPLQPAVPDGDHFRLLKRPIGGEPLRSASSLPMSTRGPLR